jgi:hypothetical protein
MSKGYYKKQLSVINIKGQYAPTFQVKSEGGDTKWMNLNTESASELREWLDENYPADMIKLDDVPDRKSF